MLLPNFASGYCCPKCLFCLNLLRHRSPYPKVLSSRLPFPLLSGLVRPPPRSHEWSPQPTAAERTKEPVGPFRVYLQYSWSPGLACSRAFGDKMAVEVGVTHKPDVTMHTLTPQDRYLIVASDGVWELISSQVSLSLAQLPGCFVDAALLMRQQRTADHVPRLSLCFSMCCCMRSFV